MTWRQTMPRGESLCRNRMAAFLHGHVDDRSNGKNSFAGKQRHEAQETSLEENCSTAVVISYELRTV